MKTEHIRIEPNRFQLEPVGSSAPFDVSYYCSPFNIPHHVSSRHDDATGHVIVEFKYLDDREPTVCVVSDSGMEVMLGKNSDRIFAIHATNDLTQDRSRLQRAMFHLFGMLANRHSRGADSYSIARQVIATNQERLLHPA